MRHEHHIFHNPPSSTPAAVHAALDRGDLPAALDAMVGTALYGDGDWSCTFGYLSTRITK
ncbi:hypothetical protein [Micromonospora arida]|uniref:hypothetical protein n=1 Tax=Micromonospora arida TaxID=2203715 RepID=UPI001FC9AF25|nr:hypothetical protein [Micromonospora arida]